MASKQNLPAEQDWVDSFGHHVTRCTARTKKNGQRCTHPAVEGYTVCRMHGANPKNHGGAPPEKLRGNLNGLIHGAYVKRILDEQDQELFDRTLEAIRHDFDLNKSTDQIQAAMAAFYFTRWYRAIEGKALSASSTCCCVSNSNRSRPRERSATRAAVRRPHPPNGPWRC
ncbi:MAG: hypothetical protein P9M14_17010 [Candidatus Alcyoniella australis]|nr:hypothetical protein [Candidatus Alcyoniella australis]